MNSIAAGFNGRLHRRGLFRCRERTNDFAWCAYGNCRRYFIGTLQPAISADWWMLQNSDDGRQCGPPLEADGVVLTPDEILKRFDECS